MKKLITRYPVFTYFVVTFGVSWAGVLAVTGGVLRTDLKAQSNPLFVWAVLAMIVGPALAGLVLTAVPAGRRGLRELRSRVLGRRISPAWYALAVLAAPLSALTASMALSLISSDFLPAILVVDNKVAILVLGVVVGVAAGVLEELGWTGFAIPRLLRRHGVVATGLAVGLLWSAWHVPVVIWGVGDRAGAIPLAVFVVVDGLAGLPAFRVLMVWVYDRTQSVLLAMLMHISLTATTLIMTPRTAGIDLLAYDLAFAAIVWGLVVAGGAANPLASVRVTLRRKVLTTKQVDSRGHV
jgi:membrane protease YdiL (CAAX protease family)